MRPPVQRSPNVHVARRFFVFAFIQYRPAGTRGHQRRDRRSEPIPSGLQSLLRASVHRSASGLQRRIAPANSPDSLNRKALGNVDAIAEASRLRFAHLMQLPNEADAVLIGVVVIIGGCKCYFQATAWTAARPHCHFGVLEQSPFPRFQPVPAVRQTTAAGLFRLLKENCWPDG